VTPVQPTHSDVDLTIANANLILPERRRQSATNITCCRPVILPSTTRISA
jgi:hypothetical protein